MNLKTQEDVMELKGYLKEYEKEDIISFCNSLSIKCKKELIGITFFENTWAVFDAVGHFEFGDILIEYKKRQSKKYNLAYFEKNEMIIPETKYDYALSQGDKFKATFIVYRTSDNVGLYAKINFKEPKNIKLIPRNSCYACLNPVWELSPHHLIPLKDKRFV